MYILIFTHIYTYMYMYIYIYIYTHIYIYIQEALPLNFTCAQRFVFMGVGFEFNVIQSWVIKEIYIYVCTCIYICAFVYIYTQETRRQERPRALKGSFAKWHLIEPMGTTQHLHMNSCVSSEVIILDDILDDIYVYIYSYSMIYWMIYHIG